MPVAKGNEARISNLRQIHFQIFLATQLYFGRQNSKIPSFWLNWACFSKMKATFRLFPIQSSERILLLKNVLDKKQSNGFKKDQTIIVLSENAWWMIAINECLKVQRKSLDKESGPFTIPSFERWKLRNSMSVSQECIDIIIHFCICAYYCKNEWRKNKLNTMHVSPHVDKVYHHLQDLSFPIFSLFFSSM